MPDAFLPKGDAGSRGIQPRDDNLRLIFAPVEQQLIDERILDLRAGALLLVIFCAATGLFTWGMLTMNYFAWPKIPFLGLSLHLAWMMSFVVSLLSPLIAIVLGVEYAKVLRRRRDHDNLMRRYGRA